MKKNDKAMLMCAVAVLTATAATAKAEVMEFTDKVEWESAVRAFTTIGFTEFPDGTHLFDQYAELGILFPDGDDNIICCSDNAYPNDGSGLDGNEASHLVFLTPQSYIAADFPGGLQIQLFSEGNLIYTSSDFGGTGVGFFAGLISSELFDEAILVERIGQTVFLDDLHFGVPTPGAIALLGLAALFPRRRERRLEA